MKVIVHNLAVSMLVGASVCSLLIGNSKVTPATNTYETPISPSIALASGKNSVKDTVKVAPAVKPAQFKATVTSKKQVSLDEWLEKLAQKESNNDGNLKILDVNGKYSYGCLQFQMGTFQSYIKRFNLLSDLDLKGWEASIYNCALQKKLAKMMLKSDPDAWVHWYNTTLAIGLPPGSTW